MSTDTTPTETPDPVEVPDLTDPELMALVRANPLTASMQEFDRASQAYARSESLLIAARYQVAREEFARQIVASSDALAAARREAAVRALRDAAADDTRGWLVRPWLTARADAIEAGDAQP